MQTTTRVFISATSSDLASYREVVKKALLTNDVLPVEQTDFPPDFRAVTELIVQKIGSCDAVICLIGFVFGAEPLDRPPEKLRRSYTQIELDTARKLGKPVYLFIAHEDCVFDSHPLEDAEKKQLQLAHRESIRNGIVRWEEFVTTEQLRQRVAHIQFQNHSKRIRVRENLPYPSLGSLFKGRESFIDRMRQKLIVELDRSEWSNHEEVSQREVLCGLGGVGKTRLAVEYASRFKSDYSALLFVVADSPETLRRNLASLTGPMVLDLPDARQGSEEDRIAAALCWLAEHPCWCMIIDNVDSREAQKAVMELLPRLNGGHTLITSRLSESEWSHDVDPLDLGVLAPQDAKAFLLERTERLRRHKDTDEADAKYLSQELDGLALALEQAGAYIEQRRCSIDDYLKRWKAGEKRMREWCDEVKTHYPYSLAVTWDTTIRTMSPDAVSLLNLMSWFASSPVPEAILSTPVAAEVLNNQSGRDSLQNNAIYPEDALVELAAYSMVRRSVDQAEPCFVIHCVVQEITRRRIAESEWVASLGEAVKLFTGFAPRDSYRFETWNVWRILIPHAELLWRSCQGIQASNEQRDKGIPREDWNTDLLDALALFYMGQDRNEEGIPLQRLTLALKKERLSTMHPSLFLAMNDLALMLDSSYEEEKEQLYKSALEGRRLVHSEESEEVAETLHNYGCFLNTFGRFAEAEPTMRQALNVHTKVNGRLHWRTLMAGFSLAQILHSKGEAVEAEAITRSLLLDKKQALGEEHPDTLSHIAFLASILEERGEYSGSEEALHQVLEARTRVLGPAHPATIDAMTNLASFFLRIDDCSQAQILFKQALETNEQEYGVGHYLTLQTVNLMALCFAYIGDDTQAEPLYRRAIEGMTIARGKEHPETLMVMCNLSYLLQRKGNRAEAEAILCEVLEIDKRVSGPEHNRTILSVNRLGIFYDNIGDYAKAEALYRQALVTLKNKRGHEHRDTLTVVYNLADLLRKTERLTEAEELFRQILDTNEQSHGKDHPITLDSVNSIAVFFARIENYELAEPLYRRALEGKERIVGLKHPDTLLIMSNLADLLLKKGENDQAETLLRKVLEIRERERGLNHISTLSSLASLADLLEKVGKVDDSLVLRDSYIERMANKRDSASLLSLRKLALQFYIRCDYKRAEELLRSVLNRDFQVPTNRCHLARVLILTDRENEAREEVVKAWDHREKGEPYMIPRILFFQALFDFLDGNMPIQQFAKLKLLLKSESAFVEWKIQPVLDHLKTRLSQYSFDFLQALATALGDQKKLSNLDRFPEWRDAQPIEII